MAVATLKFFTTRFRVKSVILFTLMFLYICFSLFLFFQWVAPSLDGRTGQHIAADSGIYMYFADGLRSGNINPYMLAALYSFPNTLWAPVLLALALKNTFAVVVVDYALFFLALVLLKKSYSFSTWVFVALLLLNATTTISLLSVNKEIIDLFAVSIFLFANRRSSKTMLLLALLLALVNRYEICLVMIVFMIAMSKINPWVRRRGLTLAIVIILLSIMLPLFASRSLNLRFEEANGSHAVAWLDSLEMHYLYGIALFPKIMENLFGMILNISTLASYDTSDPANSYILLSNNLATAFVFVILAIKRGFSLRSDLIYFAMLGCTFVAVSLVIQPRYFYFVYVLLCLEVARIVVREPAGATSLPKDGHGGRRISLSGYKGATLG
jgi:hypothetical protein